MKKTDKKYLLIVRSGPNSLHKEWEDETRYRKTSTFYLLTTSKKKTQNKIPTAQTSANTFQALKSGLFHWLNNNPNAFETYRYRLF